MKQKVLIAGAGIAGVEAALALRDLAGDRIEVDLRDPRREFAFRPFAVGEPYGAARIFRYDMRRLVARCGASFHADGIAGVDPERRIAISRDGERVPYDYLVVAGGVRMLWAVPGAVTFWGVADEGQVGDVIADLRADRLRNLVFTMAGGRSWALPLYELALLAATELAKAGLGRTRLTVVTPEEAPLGIFGRRAGEQMEELLADRGIDVIAGAHPVKFDAGRLRIAPGEEIEADAVDQPAASGGAADRRDSPRPRRLHRRRRARPGDRPRARLRRRRHHRLPGQAGRDSPPSRQTRSRKRSPRRPEPSSSPPPSTRCCAACSGPAASRATCMGGRPAATARRPASARNRGGRRRTAR